jgi:hypothetical protein
MLADPLSPGMIRPETWTSVRTGMAARAEIRAWFRMVAGSGGGWREVPYRSARATMAWVFRLSTRPSRSTGALVPRTANTRPG